MGGRSSAVGRGTVWDLLLLPFLGGCWGFAEVSCEERWVGGVKLGA